jgi:hypothetical protein
MFFLAWFVSSLTPLAAPAVVFMLRDESVRYKPPTVRVTNFRLLDVHYQRTPTLTFVTFGRCTPAQAWGSTLVPECYAN